MRDEINVLRKTLCKPIHKELVLYLSQCANTNILLRDILVEFVFDENIRVASNATWVLSHCAKQTIYAIEKRQQDFISRCLSTYSTTQHRLLLTILSIQHRPEDIDSALFDRCLKGLLDSSIPSGTRALYIKLAYTWSRPYEDLYKEFCLILNSMDKSLFSPAVLSVIKKII